MSKSKLEKKAESYGKSIKELKERNNYEIYISLYHSLSEETFDEKIQDLENQIVIDLKKPGAKEKLEKVLEILEELKYVD